MFRWFKKEEVQKSSEEVMRDALKELDELTNNLLKKNEEALRYLETETVK